MKTALPHPRALTVLPPETVSMHTRDGTRLDADIWRPATGGPYPVLLQRQAYGRRIACTICYAHPAWYAAQGYIVVVQDVRGRGTSEGKFEPGLYEVQDGADTVAWAASLPGTTGAVGMYGFSYQAYNQLLAAAEAPPALKALAPAMGPWHARDTWAYENGALRLKQTIGWGLQIATETARRAGDLAAYAKLAAAAQSLPFFDGIAARPKVLLEDFAHHSHVPAWLSRAAGDPIWDSISPSHYLDRIQSLNLPMLFIGGWFDSHLGSTLAMHAALSADGGARRPLVVGPWLHFPWSRRVGQLDFGPEAALDTDRLHIRWFDHWLKGLDTGVTSEAPVRLFDMGTKTWRDYAAMPASPLALQLAGSGRASIDDTDGLLLPAAEAPGVEPLVHDPWRPAPVVGGVYGTPPGAVDRSAVETRGDILTFTTAALEAPLTLAGTMTAHLRVEADRPSFDLSCTLSRVTPSGQVFEIACGYRHLREGAEGVVDVPMLATCCTIAPGERLRLAVAASAFPAYPVNPGTGGDPASTPTAEALVTTIMLRHGEGQESWLALTRAEEPA